MKDAETAVAEATVATVDMVIVCVCVCVVGGRREEVG